MCLQFLCALMVAKWTFCGSCSWTQVLAAACTAFGVLWLRALSRVRSSLAERSAIVTRVELVLTSLPTSKLAGAYSCVALPSMYDVAYGQLLVFPLTVCPLCVFGVAGVERGLVLLQAVVRGRQAQLRYQRVLAMECFVAAAPARNHMLRLVNALVAVYLCMCLYIIALYSRCPTTIVYELPRPSRRTGSCCFLLILGA